MALCSIHGRIGIWLSPKIYDFIYGKDLVMQNVLLQLKRSTIIKVAQLWFVCRIGPRMISFVGRFLEKHNIAVLPWPAKSLDLYPIKHL